MRIGASAGGRGTCGSSGTEVCFSRNCSSDIKTCIGVSVLKETPREEIQSRNGCTLTLILGKPGFAHPAAADTTANITGRPFFENCINGPPESPAQASQPPARYPAHN